ncbi:16S rRNA (cytosine(1402)-N(4))-methyltransferase RsmH [Mollicutes bacterium LVI A0039]|nr:16S rRNA (cytosine(1402)-N(4))-methyltransferase RsmH [Mollicutes bacterium LVI A0039]
MFSHYTVMLEESIEGLNIKPDGIYVDATLGGAGHSQLIRSKLTTGHLYCFDQDQIAIDNAKEVFGDDAHVTIIKSNFCHLKSELNNRGVTHIDGILFDLGVSSMQLDVAERGFSYTKSGPLDMRMDNSISVTAKDIVNNYSEQDLAHIFTKYGEEKFAKLYAKEIVVRRDEQPFTDTLELNQMILDTIPRKYFYKAKSHPSKRVFQALRIEVNKELDVFEQTLVDSFEMLNVGGRISCITFHSLEDKICKYYFKAKSEVRSEFKNLPVIPEEYLPLGKMVTRKPILPSSEELEVNTRSLSAKLRVFEKERDEKN